MRIRSKTNIATKELGLSEKDMNRYSIIKAVGSLYDPIGVDAKFERDLSQQICKRDNRATHGIIIPQEILEQRYASYLPRSSHILTDQAVHGLPAPNNMRQARVKRGMMASVNSQGGYLVDDQLRSLLEVLVENTLLLQNVPILNVMGSPVNIPGLTTRPTVQSTHEAPIVFGAIAFDDATTQTAVDALSAAAFALITISSSKYLAFAEPSTDTENKLRSLQVNDVLKIGTQTYTVQARYDETKDRIQVQDAAVSTGLTDGTSYAIEVPNEVAESDLTFSNIAFQQKFLKVQLSFSRTAALMSSTDLEMMARNDMALGIGKAMDTAMIFGTGSNNQPLGIKNTTGINSVSWDASDVYGTVLECMKLVGEANIPMNNIKWLASWFFPVQMKRNKMLPGNSRKPIMGKDGKIEMIDVEVTSQIQGTNANKAEGYYGNYSECVATLWQDLEIEPDPYTLLHQGLIRLIATVIMDFNVLRPKAFARLGA